MLDQQTQVELRKSLEQVNRTHSVECSGLGEVTCLRCRDKGWMTLDAYHRHLVDLQMSRIGAALWSEYMSRD